MEKPSALRKKQNTDKKFLEYKKLAQYCVN